MPIPINFEDTDMKWDRIEGNWTHFKGNVKAQWGKLTDDRLAAIAGKRDHLAGEIQATYGISKHAAKWQLSGWQGRQMDNLR
jgi:uncharacterized protein YjbJ (UPF0337 family)